MSVKCYSGYIIINIIILPGSELAEDKPSKKQCSIHTLLILIIL